MDATTSSTTGCLVIGGGGVTGIAWATGLLLGLERAGFALREADRLVGTSAGSAIVAQLQGERSLDALHESQVRGDVDELPGSLGVLGIVRLLAPQLWHRDAAAGLRAVGRFALRTGGERAGARRAVIEQRLDGATWSPGRDVRIVATDVDSGERTVFSPGGTASLADAVEASCAVPGVWPVVTIDGRRCMDGGVRSPANVDLAEGSRRLVVIAPIDRAAKRSATPSAELAALDAAGVVIAPDADAKQAMGSNPLDPAARAAAAEAGLAQAEREVQRVAAVW